MAKLDFFAAHDDQFALVEFLFSQTDLRAFESDSPLGQELTEFTTAEQLDQHFSLGVDRHGNGSAILLQRWSPSAMAQPDIERIILDPRRCDGHNSQQRARVWGIEREVNWKALAKVSNKIQYHIRGRLAAARVPGRCILPQAYELARQGYQLKEAAGSPWHYDVEQSVLLAV